MLPHTKHFKKIKEKLLKIMKTTCQILHALIQYLFETLTIVLYSMSSHVISLIFKIKYINI